MHYITRTYSLSVDDDIISNAPTLLISADGVLRTKSNGYFMLLSDMTISDRFVEYTVWERKKTPV